MLGVNPIGEAAYLFLGSLDLLLKVAFPASILLFRSDIHPLDRL